MKKLSIIIIVLLSISGCKRTYCPEFPANLNYFPYYSGQELKFVNSQQDFCNLIISDQENSESWSYDRNCKCACDAFSTFRTYKNQDLLYINASFSLNGGEMVSLIRISFLFPNSEYLAKNVDIGKFVPYNEIYKYLEDTITIEDDNNQIFNKVVIVKGKGLVSYTMADGEEWKLIE